MGWVVVCFAIAVWALLGLVLFTLKEINKVYDELIYNAEAWEEHLKLHLQESVGPQSEER